MTVVFHADDYGITARQARAILALSGACGGHGALRSVSIFANSPAFEEAAALAAPHVENGQLCMALHVNLVEGRPCAPAREVPLLVNERGTFGNDFVGLLKLSLGSHRAELRAQVQRECEAQLSRFLTAFPQLRSALRVDSHQHPHAIPAVLDGVLAAVRAQGCTLAHLRTPVEPAAPHRVAARARQAAGMPAAAPLPPINRVKAALLAALWRANRAKLPAGCATSLFCGVLLSGCMERVDAPLVHAFAEEAQRRGQDAELLFHPVSVPIAECLDPENAPFAEACASAGRDAEARALVQLAGMANTHQ